MNISASICGNQSFSNFVPSAIPSIIYFLFVFVECGLYFKAGNKIRNKSLNLFNISSSKSNEEIKKNTDWFYKDSEK